LSHSLIRYFIKDNSVITLGNILVNLKSVLLMPLIIKTVGVTTYGWFVLLTTMLGIVYGISSFGASFKAQRFLPSTTDNTKRRKLFYRQFFFQMASIMSLSLLLVLMNNDIVLFFFNNSISYSVFIIPLYLLSYLFYSQLKNLSKVLITLPTLVMD